LPFTPGLAAGAEWAVAVSGLVAVEARVEFSGEKAEQLARRHLAPALRHYLHARDCCPLLGTAQVQLAANVTRMPQADPRRAYLDRAKLVAPSDAEVWYIAGIQELLDEQPERAWKSWRRSLEISDQYLPQILDPSARLLTPTDLLGQVL